MIDLKLLRKNPDLFYEALRKRNYSTEILDKIVELDKSGEITSTSSIT